MTGAMQNKNIKFIDIKPQPGPQTAFLKSGADFVVTGGSGGGGKGQALDTPLPTPSGFKLMADIQPGDQVFDEDGNICNVTSISEIHHRDVFEIIFDDGSKIKADDVHRWLTLTEKERTCNLRLTDEWRAARRARRESRAIENPKNKKWQEQTIAYNKSKVHIYKQQTKGQVRTTLELFKTLKHYSGGRPANNHSIDVAKPINTPHADLLLDPYTLGLFAGDGYSAEGYIGKLASDMLEIIDYIPYEVEWKRIIGSPKYKQDYCLTKLKGFKPILKNENLLKNKHIPQAYLRASIEQRKELLRGILDTDGHVTKRGAIELGLSNKRLADDCLELILSLGIKATMTVKKTKCNDNYRMKFMCSFPAFKLKRKLARQKMEGLRDTTKRRYIVDIRPIPSEPTKCITVDSPSHLYLTGKSFIPTHNTYALCLDPLKHVKNPQFRAVTFRTKRTDIVKPGGIWDEAKNIYLRIKGVRERASPYLDFTFPSGAQVAFAHVNENNYEDWKSTAIPGMNFEELTTFSENAFFYMFSRNRSTCGVLPYVRATTNPQKNWVYYFIKWWIGDDGFAIKERSGVIRWFIRQANNEIIWADTREELIYSFGKDCGPVSFTFIPSHVTDNKILLEKSPQYLSMLKSMNDFDRAQLLEGNWLAVPKAGTYFKRQWVEIVDAIPADSFSFVRAWDRAATKPNPQNTDPDYTAGVKMCRDSKGFYYVLHVERFRDTATQDTINTQVLLLEDPGQAGKAEALYLTRALAGYNVQTTRAVSDKLTYFKPFSAQAQAGNIKILRRGPQDDKWIEEFLNELEQFVGDGSGKDDQVDGVSHAFLKIAGYNTGGIFFF
jgi:predicted phage terminase large subunit-like protein